MNWQHFRAFIWLRWRLLVNQWRRAGKFTAALMIFITFASIILGIPLLIGCFALAAYLIPQAQPSVLMYAWDGLLVAFLIFWMIGLMTDLQRTESLALSKFMHLPVSVNGAFLLNYLSSLLRISLFFFGPIMLAYSLALIYALGPRMILVPLSLAALFLMVTALTYQFQGWLASLMSNPRRRRSVIVTVTLLFVAIGQLPNLLNVMFQQGRFEHARRANEQTQAELKALQDEVATRRIDIPEWNRRQHEIEERTKRVQAEAAQKSLARVAETSLIIHIVVPFGWLPLGVKYAAEGVMWPSVLGLLGMTAIGAASLWRAYHTTVRIYQGAFSSKRSKKAAPAGPAAPGVPKERRNPIEARIPALSEPAQAIALSSFRAFVRAPESKMMLLSPIIMCVVFGPLAARGGSEIPVWARPLVAVGAMGVLLMGMIQFMGNQFGFDRDGFRVYVLCAAPRREILMGKNLAFAPVFLIFSAIVLIGVQLACPLRVDDFLALIPQFISMYLMCCLFTNLVSIYTPVYIAAGSMKPTNIKLTTVLLQLLLFMFLFPLAQGVTLIPLGISALVSALGGPAYLPVFLILALLECALIVFVYHLALDGLGSLLQARELKILDTVTNRPS